MLPIKVLSLLGAAEVHEKKGDVDNAYTTYLYAWDELSAKIFIANTVQNKTINYYKNRATAYLALGRKENAISDLQLTIRKTAISLEKLACHYYIGRLYEGLGDYEKAALAYYQANCYDQKKVIIHQVAARWNEQYANSSQYQQGVIQFYIGEMFKKAFLWQEALAQFDLVLQNETFSDMHIDASVARAECQMALNPTLEQITQMIDDCTQAIKIKPQAKPYELRMNAYLKLATHKQTSEEKLALYKHASADCETLIFSYSTSTDQTKLYYSAQFDIYNLEDQLKGKDEAKGKILKNHTSFIHEHPHQPLPYKMRMLYYLELREYEKALNDANSMIQVHINYRSNDADYHKKLGEYYKDRVEIYLKLNNIEQAANAYKHDCLYGVYVKNPEQFRTDKETIEKWFANAISEREAAFAKSIKPVASSQANLTAYTMDANCQKQFAEAIAYYTEITAHSKEKPPYFNSWANITPTILLDAINQTFGSHQKIHLLRQCKDPETTLGCFIYNKKYAATRAKTIADINTQLESAEKEVVTLDKEFPITATYKTAASALFFAKANSSLHKKITPEMAVFHRILLDLSMHKEILKLNKTDETIIEYLKRQTSWENINQWPPASNNCSQWIRKLMYAAKNPTEHLVAKLEKEPVSEGACNRLEAFREIHNLIGVEIELMEEINASKQSVRRAL